MPDTQKFGPQTFPKYKADIFDMVQNALEENNMTKAKVYMWKSVIDYCWQKEELSEHEKFTKTPQTVAKLEVSQTKFARLLSC